LSGRDEAVRIAISGAGVAGPALAYWLLRAGHEPTLIESAPSLRTGGYMIDFWGVGFDVAERMGLVPAIKGAGYDLQDVRYVDQNGRIVGRISADTMRRELGDRFTSLPRGDLALLIYQALGRGVETLFGTSIIAVDDTCGRVSLTLANGGQRVFDLLIGADGLHSNVRGLVFGPAQRFERPIGYYVGAFTSRGYRPRDELAYVSYGIPGRQISRFALSHDRTMFLFVFAAGRLRGGEPDTLAQRKRTLAEVFDDSGWEWPRIRLQLDASKDVYFDRVSQVAMGSWSRGRVALVGDAAACISLVGGEGTGLAMTEAYVMAGEIARHDGDHAVAFAAYERRLRPFVEGKQRAARAFAGSFAPRTALGVWLRNQATRLMAVPGVPNLLMSAQLRDALELPDYVFLQRELDG
jgi:2-polyprenyl-6-methoxyphenol hydroxylase-like FAD-dependent oxidoreductase